MSIYLSPASNPVLYAVRVGLCWAMHSTRQSYRAGIIAGFELGVILHEH